MDLDLQAGRPPELQLPPEIPPEQDLPRSQPIGSMHPEWLKSAEIAGGVALLAVATAGAFSLRFTFSASAFVYFLIIVLAALRWGFWYASVFSVAAVACLDYFFTEPLLSLRVSAPSDWTALIAFEFAGIVISRLSSQAQHHALVAELERRNIEKLYRLSRRVILLDPHLPAGAQIAKSIRVSIEVDSVAVFDAAKDEVYTEGPRAGETEERARTAWANSLDADDPTGGAWSRVLRLGGKSTGSLAVHSRTLNPLLADAVCSIAAIAIERSRALEQETRAEAARQGDQLRTAVLDALAHAFKTPLTAIRAVSSGLLEAGSLTPAQTEMIALVDSETERLNELATRLLQTARLEGSRRSVRWVECDPSKAVAETLSNFAEQTAARELRVSVPDPCPTVPGDPELIATALNQIVDNALKYSWPGTPISVSVTLDEREVVMSVHNFGPPIGSEDRERIFDRFYRSRGAEYRAAGTGLGLSIARKVAEAHGGRTWVVSSAEAGTTFFLALPLRRGETGV